jgi:L-2-hydroxyglutarate oxidase LhgO
VARLRNEDRSVSEEVNVVVIGGGVVGLAIAAELARDSEDLFVLEAEPRPGLGTSTRNSGVIHAGMYYPTGSLKAEHCRRGAELLYSFCQRHQVPHRQAGKLIVATTEAQIPMLERLQAQGERNGVADLRMIDRAEIRAIEPHVEGVAALHSPRTGILEPEELIRALARLAQERGVSILPHTPVVGIEAGPSSLKLRTPREEVRARVIINAAGLYADEVAGLVGPRPYTIYPCRGEYAEVIPSRRDLVNGLVYPVPDPTGHGLGVHLTRTLDGQLLLGPNARYVDRKDAYEGGLAPLESFYQAAVGLLPDLRPEDLRPSYSGIRAKRFPADGPSFADFVVEHDPEWPHIIHLIGIESPGLTSALSLASTVAEMVRGL